jgi:alkaline phosphatase D
MKKQWIVIVALCGLFGVSTVYGQGSPSMTESTIVGAMTSSSAKITVRTDQAADVEIEYAENKNFNNSTTTTAQTTASSDDYTTTVALSSLNADDIYWYRILVDSVIQSTGNVQKFTTFPSGSTDSCTFAVFADVANVDRVATSYKNGKDDDALFALQIGDFDHRDPQTLTAMRAMHRDMKDESLLHGGDFAEHITSKMALVHVWDDHDYGGNDEDKDFAGREDAQQAFDEHWPTYSRPNAAEGLWHSFTCGAAEFFVLDLRSQRDPGTDTDDSDKSMLDGDLITDDQKDWLKDGLDNSTAKWKIIVSSVNTNKDARPSSIDIWHSYSTEAEEIADYISDNSIDDVFVLSADLHTGGGIDDGTNGLFGVPEMTMPHTNLVGGAGAATRGTWSEGVTNGARGYGIVTITSTSATLEVYAQNGSLRHDLTL